MSIDEVISAAYRYGSSRRFESEERSDKRMSTLRTAIEQHVAEAVRERDEARAEVERLRKTLDEIATYWNGSHRPAETLDAAEWTQGVAEEALAATEAARKFCGVGELERAGYIPAGSADEREAKP